MTISYVVVESRRLAVDVGGTGPLVIASPAMGDTREAYRPLAEHLIREGFRVALVDLRGHGESDTGFDRYGDEATANDLLAVIDELGGGPAFVAGASMSAAAAVIAAGRRPEVIAGLVLLGPFLRNGAGVAMRIGMRALLARPWGPTVWRSYASRLWPGLGEDAAKRARETTQLLTGPGRWPAFTATTRTDHAVVAPWLPRVTAPSLVVMGEADPDWKDPRAEAEWVVDQLRSELLMVPGVGHAPMLEAPEIVGPRVAQFLKETAGAARRS